MRCLSSTGELISALAITALLPVLANNPYFFGAELLDAPINVISAIILLGSICPFCALLGYLTPSLIGRIRRRRAGGCREGLMRSMSLVAFWGPLFRLLCFIAQLSERYVIDPARPARFSFFGSFFQIPTPMAALGWGWAHRKWALVWSSFCAEDF